eukprot:scaffold63382_cov42-Cyclotella_meneghiniana.AAC.1
MSTDEKGGNEAKEDEAMTEVPEAKAAADDESRNEMGNNGNEKTEMKGQGHKDEEKPDNKIVAQGMEDEEQDARANDIQETTTADSTKDEQEAGPKDDERNDEGEKQTRRRIQRRRGKIREGRRQFSV